MGPDGVSVEVVKNTQIQLKACDKDQLGLFASQIRAWRPPEPYKGKGIVYEGEIVRRKQSLFLYKALEDAMHEFAMQTNLIDLYHKLLIESVYFLPLQPKPHQEFAFQQDDYILNLKQLIDLEQLLDNQHRLKLNLIGIVLKPQQPYY